jgi:hypothetical protein
LSSFSFTLALMQFRLTAFCHVFQTRARAVGRTTSLEA